MRLASCFFILFFVYVHLVGARGDCDQQVAPFFMRLYRVLKGCSCGGRGWGAAVPISLVRTLLGHYYTVSFN